VLSTLIRIPFYGNILLDAGEGTWGQMARHFGLDEDDENSAWQVLRDLKCIFISHLHSDHHSGLAQILAKRQLVRDLTPLSDIPNKNKNLMLGQLNPPPDDPLYIVSVRGLHMYIRELSDIQDLGLGNAVNGVVSVMSESLHFREYGRYLEDGKWSVGGKESWLDYHT
jgi:ribonuclease Z